MRPTHRTNTTNLSRRKVRHVQVETPGDLVCFDTFHVGDLKGVGGLWQLTPCDADGPYAMAKVVPANNATEAASFLRDVVVVGVKKAGWRPCRVLTDGGSGFKADFDLACREANVRDRRTKPRHAWAHEFVERLQGTILHERWRIAFRRRYFRRRRQLQGSPDSFLELYNFQRPHQG